MWNKIFFIVFAAFMLQTANAQKDEVITIKGKVVNSNYQPVLGAVIYIDNMKTGNVTKSDGTYKIKVSSSAVNLGVRSPEYGDAEKPIEGKTKIDFVLGGEAGTAGGTPEIPSFNDQPKGKKINAYNDIYQMIRAEVPGVVVSGRSLQIKQGHSFFGSGAPLLVVNGVIVSSIDNVNPLEVKSIQVLTGSSAAIYGVRGSNGVISITLLNGSEKAKQ
jgi:TonB-dependent SusC/RagA subfamily outer membrane receptor